jgi:leader peptidase (prepilin peptidase)/N-methyltransferase
MFLYLWLFAVFVFGLMVGSFLNVVVARLPLEKSLLWPGSRCGNCLQRVRWYDNLPLVSYLVLRGRCRTCKAHFSPRYFFVELATGLGFLGLFYLEVVLDVHGWGGAHHQLRPQWLIRKGIYPWQWWVGWGFHAILFSLLLAAAVCDLSGRAIPMSLTLTGTLIGLIGAALFPWPWPADPGVIPAQLLDRVPRGVFANPWIDDRIVIPAGLYPWPFWGPPPEWAPPGSWQMGLVTGLVGALVGSFLMRAIAFLFGTGLGREALGLGDADLMMMAGAFLGWQVVVTALFVSVLPALVIGLIQLAVFSDRSQPFVPSLAAGVLLTLFFWGDLGGSSSLRFLFFTPVILLAVAGLGAMFLFVAAFVIRLARGEVLPSKPPAG